MILLFLLLTVLYHALLEQKFVPRYSRAPNEFLISIICIMTEVNFSTVR